jgi:antitoxin VapB
LAYAAAYAKGSPTMLERKVSVFLNGRSRAIRIPKEFDLPGDEVMLRQTKGGPLRIEPISNVSSLLEYLRTLEPLDETIGEIEDLPPEDVEI